MNLLRAATLSVADLDAAVGLYSQWLDYEPVERGLVEADLAASWGAKGSAGRAYAVLRPASGVDAYLRLIEDAPVADYRPLRTFGWAAIEISCQDVTAVAERMARSPFEIVGPPKSIEGLPPIIRPMQVQGPDGEIVYLTEIRPAAQAAGLPMPQAFIDRLFILVMACSDMTASSRWFTERLKLTLGAPTPIVYSMINKAFDLPADTRHVFAMGGHEAEVFIEFDQYPPGATPRPGDADRLAPGVALCTLKHPAFDTIDAPWITPPVRRDGAIYGGRRAGSIAGPDGTTIEVVEA